MAISSINFQKTKANSTSETTREFEANYLLEEKFRKENEFWKHSKTEKELFENELKKAKRKGGPTPKFENSCWEAVMNLNENHTLEDLLKVAKHIESKFNITSSRIALHRDEGHIKNGKPIYNYHAHLNFVTYKDGRQNWRRELITQKKLSELQTEVAKILKMDRGIKNSVSKRLSHSDFRELKRREDLKLQPLLDTNYKLSEKIIGLEIDVDEFKKNNYSLETKITELEQKYTNNIENTENKVKIKYQDDFIDEILKLLKIQKIENYYLNFYRKLKLKIKELEQLKIQKNEMIDEITDLVDEIDSLNNKLNDKDNQIEDLNTVLTQKDNQIASEKRKNTDLKNKLTEYTGIDISDIALEDIYSKKIQDTDLTTTSL